MTTDYVHVDVFSSLPYSGDSLAVFPDARGPIRSGPGYSTCLRNCPSPVTR